MLPGLVNAHRWLAALHARPGGDREKARTHRQIASDLLKRRREQLTAAAGAPGREGPRPPEASP